MTEGTGQKQPLTKAQKKHIEALAELFESEKAYLNDLHLWQYQLQLRIIKIRAIPPKRKYNICRIIFGNLSTIFRLHRDIFREMKNRNREVMRNYPDYFTAEELEKSSENQDINELEEFLGGEGKLEYEEKDKGRNGQANMPFDEKDKSDEQNKKAKKVKYITDKFIIKKDGSMDTSKLEYASIFISKISEFNMYKKYVSRLPKAEYEFNALRENNSEFRGVIEEFLTEDGVSNLGAKNFFYRPSGKIMRYPLLFKAVFKYEPNEEYRKLYERAMTEFKKVAKEIDRVFKERSQLFKMYLLSRKLAFSGTAGQHSTLALIFKSTRLIKEGRVLVQDNPDTKAYYKAVYIFNHFIALCEITNVQEEKVSVTEPLIYLAQLMVIRKDFPLVVKDEKLKAFFPLYLIHRNQLFKKIFYFEDQSTRDVYFEKISKAISKRRKGFKRDGTRVVEEGAMSQDSLMCVCKANPLTVSLQEPVAEITFKESREEMPHYLMELSEEKDENKDENSTQELKKSSNHSTDESTLSDQSISPDMIINSYQSNKITNVHKPKKDNEKQSDSSSERFMLGLEDIHDSSSDYSNWTSHSWTDAIGEDAFRNKFLLGKLEKESELKIRQDNPAAEPDEVKYLGGPGNSSSEEANLGGKCSAFCSFFSFTSPVVNEMNFTKPTGNAEINASLTVYSTPQGIFKKSGEAVTQLSTMSATKLIYDGKREVLFYLCGDVLYASQLNNRSMKLNGKEIFRPTQTFFYESSGRTPDMPNRNESSHETRNASHDSEHPIFLVVISRNRFSFTLVHLLNVVEERESFRLGFYRKLYVGFDVDGVSFMGKKMVMASKDFEIIEVDSLLTQEFLDIYDPITSILYFTIRHLAAVAIFRINRETLLLCLDGVGFYVDPMGRFKHTSLFFIWETRAREFRVCGKEIICLSATSMAVFSLETAEMVFCAGLCGLHFVDGTKEPLVYDRNRLYRYVTAGEGLKEEKTECEEHISEGKHISEDNTRVESHTNNEITNNETYTKKKGHDKPCKKMGDSDDQTIQGWSRRVMRRKRIARNRRNKPDEISKKKKAGAVVALTTAHFKKKKGDVARDVELPKRRGRLGKKIHHVEREVIDIIEDRMDEESSDILCEILEGYSG